MTGAETLIHRDDPVETYVTIGRESAQSPTLSYMAKGVLAELCSRPRDWEVSAERMASPTEGRRRIQAAFRELTEAGHLHHVRLRLSGGRFAVKVHVWRIANPQCGLAGCADCPAATDIPEPVSRSHLGEQGVSAGRTDIPVTDSRLTDGRYPVGLKKERTETKDTEVSTANAVDTLFSTPPARPRQASTAEFDRFWSTYPRKIGKEAARKSWARVTKTVPAEEIITAADRFAAARRGADPQYTPHPATWLNQGRYADEDEDTARSGPRDYATWS